KIGGSNLGGRQFENMRLLQEIPDSGSNVNTDFMWGWHSSKTSELLSVTGVSVLKDKLGNENTPQELLMCVSPPPKRQKVKEPEFVIVRRPRRLLELAAGVSWDALPDELLLGIFSYLSLTDLLKVSLVCQRWHRLSLDESLWQTLDLAGRNLLPGVIGHLLPLGITAFRCPRSCIGTLHLKQTVADLQSILSRCRSLQNLSLEGLVLSDDIIENIAQNSSLIRLNLSGCSGFSSGTLKTMLNSCPSLEELNLSWCDFTVDHVKAAVSHIPSKVTQLNLSGYRQNLLMSDVKTLLEQCPNLVHLDLSDSVMLKADCLQYFQQLTHLEHLSLSRCYQISPSVLLEFCEIATLKTLQVFGIVTAGFVQLLKATFRHLKINSSPFTPVARPAVGCKKNEQIWGIHCRLSLKSPAGF
uniref:S-phase kinase-associated protein 2 n=1 Tax=Anolis carolinensis TaxID=28377 RepID=A0A803TXJ5_ANOCA